MRSLLTVILAVSAGASGVWLGAQQPQQPQVTFRLEADYIEVDAVVTDAQGNVVRNLQREDFEVLEDKRPQTIDVFSFVDIPLERDDRPLYRPTAVEPDVVTNERELEGRIYVLLLDSNHVPAANSYLVKKAARLFIDRYLGANDLASVVHAQTGSVDDNQEFTSSKPALRVAVEKFVGEKVRSKALNVYDAFVTGAGRGFDPSAVTDPTTLERAAKADATIDAIMRVSRYMAGIRGRRKAVVLFSEGLDFNLDDTVGPRSSTGLANPFGDNSVREALHAAAIRDHMQAMYEVATRANVAIYSIDPRGLASDTDALLQTTGLPPGLEGFVPLMTSGVRDELRRELGTLRTFSEVTGGVAHVGTNDFDAGFRRIVLDNSAYYVLGYRPAELKHDGKFHDITVRVKRPGVQVRARRGYYAVKDTKPNPVPPADPTVELLNSPMPLGGLGLRLTTSTMKGTASNVRVHVTVEVAGRDVALDPKNDSIANSVKLSYVALDLSGKIRASGLKTMDVSINPETRQTIADRGLRLVMEIELPPGRYQLRVAGHEALGGRTGSVFRDLDVADFTKSPLVMSHLALTSASAGRTPTGYDAPSLKDLLPGPPTASREFVREDTLAILAEIYDNEAARLHTVDLSATVRTDDGTQVFVAREERSSRDLGSERGGYTYVVRIPLRDLAPGRYVLTMEARSRLGGDPATREIQFVVK
ncbi:MAG TPA: VWA domain-containing protein [Vicinamibacterales bacterium]|nr:VWA domain-containing protein [Vicinamibacterales bacterium]